MLLFKNICISLKCCHLGDQEQYARGSLFSIRHLFIREEVIVSLTHPLTLPWCLCAPIEIFGEHQIGQTGCCAFHDDDNGGGARR